VCGGEWDGVLGVCKKKKKGGEVSSVVVVIWGEGLLWDGGVVIRDGGGRRKALKCCGWIKNARKGLSCALNVKIELGRVTKKPGH